MTAVENVAVPLVLARRPGSATEARRLLGCVGLADRLHHYPGQLSGGEQQRVAIARAFASRPRLLLADEPTGNLDQATGRAVIDLLFTLHKEAGTTLLLITHDPALAERCNRQVRIEDGRIGGDAALRPATFPMPSARGDGLSVLGDEDAR
jgi:putative ABC transport system ATP-binding protein